MIHLSATNIHRKKISIKLTYLLALLWSCFYSHVQKPIHMWLYNGCGLLKKESVKLYK